MSETPAPAGKARFPRTFWTANTIELFERAAYYSMASFMVIYLNEKLGMSPATATLLNGTVLWGLIYFLPILSGTIADKYGYKKSLSVSLVLISIGYLIMGNLQGIWPGLTGAAEGAPVNFLLPVVIAIVFIGVGGSIVKPCIAGTVQKTAGVHATLAFGIFYMVINIGSITGRGVSYFVRTAYGIPAIFTYVATVFAILGLGVVLFLYKEPQFVSDGKKDGQVVKRRTLGEALLGIITVLGNIRFVFFLLVLALFWFLYSQLYNLMPLFMRFIDPNAPMELYTLANPLMIVCFQLLITKFAKRWTPIKSIMFGVAVTTVGMVVNVLPTLLWSDAFQKVNLLGLVIPAAGIFMIVSIASMATGEMFASPRIYEYVGALAPKGQEGLYLGYSNLPVALGSILGGGVGGKLFQKLILDPREAGGSPQIATLWLIIGAVGIVSFVGLGIYNSWLKRALQKEGTTAA
ncbi:MAG: MFS transporter [Candidatus Aminicenantes bacterium]|nr:MFS transporter [Candidatus Aminicenantes bacterium]